MYQVQHAQNAIGRLLTLLLSGTYLSNTSKVSYPFFRRIHSGLDEEIQKVKQLLCEGCNIESRESLHEILARSVKWFHSRTKGGMDNPHEVTVEIARNYDRDLYHDSKFDAVNSLCDYVRKRLEPYLVGAYIHGSLSTMDCTGYSDLDTLFVIKQEALEDPKKIEKLEKLFIKSTKYLYEFDPLQHHGHFFLTESDLKYYNQAILPLSAIRLSTSIMDRGKNLTFCVRDSKQESEIRFINSIKILHRYIKEDISKLNAPYYLKGFLSHFMILPVLFLQLRGEYVSKKDSFEIVKERVPPGLWRCMEQVGEIRQNWNQATSALKRRFMKIVGMWNPLLLAFFSVHFYKCQPMSSEILNARLLSEMYGFTEYLLELSGLNENRLEDK